MADRWVKCIARSGNLRATAITAADLVESARRRHKIGYAETKGLGEALMGGLLLASTCKRGERVSLSIKGEKFFRQAMVDASPSGTVRGFVVAKELQESIDPELGPWQTGLLSVVRLKENEKEPYVGTVPILTGFLAKDLTFYLSQSEQIPSSVGFAIDIGADGKVENAGAFLVQAMPGATEEDRAAVEQNISAIQWDADPTKLLAQIFQDTTFSLLEEKLLSFECNCSKDRIIRALKMLGRAELEDMVDKDKGAEVHCDFCSENYHFSIPELETVLGEM